MTARVIGTVATVAITMIATGCDRTSTANNAVTSTSPAGTTAAPSANSARHRDEALLRVVHAAPSGTNVDLFAGDLLIFDGLGFKAVTPYRAVVSDYRDVAPFDGAIQVIGEGAAAPLLATLNSHLEAGRFYTIVILGNARSTPRLEASLIEDALVP